MQDAGDKAKDIIDSGKDAVGINLFTLPVAGSEVEMCITVLLIVQRLHRASLERLCIDLLCLLVVAHLMAGTLLTKHMKVTMELWCRSRMLLDP